MKFSLLINMKMPTIVGIFIFTRACQYLTSLSHFRWTQTVTIFMLCFNICFIHRYKIARVSSHSLIRYWMSNMASDAKACFSSKVEYHAVIRYLYLKGKTGKEIHGELADVYGSSASVQLMFMGLLHWSSRWRWRHQWAHFKKKKKYVYITCHENKWQLAVL